MGCSSSDLAKNSVNQKEGVVDLFIFPRTTRSIQLSPACFKVESFLRWNKIPYIAHCVTDLGVSPTGRLPCAIIRNKLVADSELIISELILAYGIKEDHVTPKAQREGRLVRVALEYATRWHIARWQLVDHFDWTVDASREYAPSVPRIVLKAAISRMNRTPVIDMLNTHGQGDLSRDHFHDELLKDLQTVEGMISDNGGGFIVTTDRPSRFDATVYAMLNIIRVAEEIKQDAPGALFVFQSAVLQQYIKRMDDLCFPDAPALMKAGASVAVQDFSTPRLTQGE
jgi:hypothetical protein